MMPCITKVEVARHNRERPWDKMIRYTKIGAFFEGHSIASLLPPHRSKIWACPSLIIWYYLTHFSLQLFTYYYINKYVLLCFSTISHLCSKLHDICQYCWQLISADNIACTMYYRYVGAKTITDLLFLMNNGIAMLCFFPINSNTKEKTPLYWGANGSVFQNRNPFCF